MKISLEWESEPGKMLIWGVETQKDTKQEVSNVRTYILYNNILHNILKGRTQSLIMLLGMCVHHITVSDAVRMYGKHDPFIVKIFFWLDSFK